jgi:hypothetical protein
MARLFSWTVAWIGIPALLAGAALLISISHFGLAEALLFIAGIWLIGWITFLPCNRFPINNITETLLWAGIFGVFLAVGGLFYLIEGYRIDRVLAANHGWLAPAGDRTPFDNLQIIEDRSVLWLGSMPVATRLFPKAIIAIDGQTVLSVNKINGNIAISANINSKDGRVIAVLKDNEFIVNPNNILRKENPDFSTMTIYDQYNDVVLSIRNLNSRVIGMLATIRFHGQVVEIKKDGVFVNGQPKISDILIFSDVPPAIIGVTVPH